LQELDKALTTSGIDLLGGDLAVLRLRNGEYDADKMRPSLAIKGTTPVRAVALDLAGGVLSDADVTDGALKLPKRTARIAVIAGASLASHRFAGWHAGSRLAQISARTYVGAGCTLITVGTSTIRKGIPVVTGMVDAADVVDGYDVVTTTFVPGTLAVAVILENANRSTDARGDVVDIGVAGPRRARDKMGNILPPIVIDVGIRRISVFELERDNLPVEITVASGEHLHLAGVVGALGMARSLAESLSDRDIATVIGVLIDTKFGLTHVEWSKP
jgi:hypothetical protein